jgi:hypothetical protein
MPSGREPPVAARSNILLDVETNAKASGGESDEAICSRIIRHIEQRRSG